MIEGKQITNNEDPRTSPYSCHHPLPKNFVEVLIGGMYILETVLEITRHQETIYNLQADSSFDGD